MSKKFEQCCKQRLPQSKCHDNEGTVTVFLGNKIYRTKVILREMMTVSWNFGSISSEAKLSFSLVTIMST